MSKSLIGIVADAMDIARELTLTEGEADPELEAKLTVTEIELPAKVDGYAARREMLKSALEFWKDKKERADLQMKKCKRYIDFLEGNLKYAIKQLGVEKISGNESAFKLRKNPGAVIIEDESKIPQEYKISTVVTTIDKKRLGVDLKNGIPIDGCRLEMTESLMETSPDLL